MYCERQAYAASLLLERMEQETVESAPIWCGSVEDIDCRAFRGLVDIVIASPPCQPYSIAGLRIGNADRRAWGRRDSGPIAHWLRCIEEIAPDVVFAENVAPWIRRGHFAAVQDRLRGMGYAVPPAIVCSGWDVGAAHQRRRAFVMAHRGSLRRWRPASVSSQMAHAAESGRAVRADEEIVRQRPSAQRGGVDLDLFAPPRVRRIWREIARSQEHLVPATEPGFRVLADGSPVVVDCHRSEALCAAGNGCVALQVAVAFVALFELARSSS